MLAVRERVIAATDQNVHHVNDHIPGSLGIKLQHKTAVLQRNDAGMTVARKASLIGDSI